MAKSYEVEHIEGTIRYDLPVILTRGIGRVIVRWALFEDNVQHTVWETLSLTPAEGRIAVREPSVVDRLDIIRQLLPLQNGKWDNTLFKSIKKRATIAAEKRNLLAHGVWGNHESDGEWRVQLARGGWPNELKDVIEGSKKVTPEMVRITPSDLADLVNDIELLVYDFRRLRRSAIGPGNPGESD